MTHGSLTESITRSLAYMLRHQPEEFDLELDQQGYGDLEEVVFALNERLGEAIEEEDVVEAIESGDRPRYEIVEGRIRALYGHSFVIDPGEPVEPPEELYVGLGSRDASRAAEQGLRSGRRAFLHLALTFEDAREMGRRVAPEYAVVTVRAREASEEGVPFYDRKSLFLSEPIPTDFLEVSEIFDDGLHRDPRGGPKRRRSAGGGRVQGRRRRSPDDEERDWGEEREHAPQARPERAPREERSEPPARPVVSRREQPTRPTAASRATPRSDAGPSDPSPSDSEGFGNGIFESGSRSVRRPSAPEAAEPAVAGPAVADPERPAERREPASDTEAPVEEHSDAPDDGPEGGFGAGVL